ncbi:hypothetical protein [Sulfuriroseicoccus oceanibius]|uniref:Uncharacterized protein n=1 Tax=Sulfuriroseicoccus oceanibius TaxID=2707525 RepID=A0A6B3LC43_9BACT|nr:hypothetical protein [Sulfuriroseicoccus oceanibius]QQL44847.1 hypothetical protein G3M56_013360 [Sulfuriroseicoccus oceanibius]
MPDQNGNKPEGIVDLIEAISSEQMNNEDLKTILGAARPNGMDREDPLIGEALRHLDKDPTLRDWFIEEQKFDAQVSAALSEVRAPAGLKDRILSMADVQRRAEASGGDAEVVELPVSRSGRSWWQMAAAAVLLVAGTFAVTEMLHDDAPPQVADNPSQPVVTPLAGGANAVFANWQSDAIDEVEGMIARNVRPQAVPAGLQPADLLKQELISIHRSEATAEETIQALQSRLAESQLVVCQTIDSPEVGRYALICFRIDGVLMHLAVFDRQKVVMPKCQREAVQVRCDDRWQTVAWNAGGRTVMLFALSSDVPSADAMLRTFSAGEVAAL